MSVLQPETVKLRDDRMVTLRSPTPDDAQALLTYLDAVRRESQGIMFSPDDELPTLAWERDWIEQRNANPHNLMVSARSGNELIGLANVSGGGALIRGQHRAEIGISLRRSWWGRGLGRSLMNALINFGEQDESIHVLRLCVYSYNHRAIRLYERCGFEREGRRRWSVRFEDGSYADEVQMSRWVGPGGPPETRTFDAVARDAR